MGAFKNTVETHLPKAKLKLCNFVWKLIVPLVYIFFERTKNADTERLS